jgi:Fungal specific transcription factor domain
MDSPNLKSFQALSILAYKYASCGNSGRLWGITSILTGLARSMSLREIDPPPEIKQSLMSSLALLPSTDDALEIEERRRCYWALFTLTGFISGCTGWTKLLPEKQPDLPRKSPEERVTLNAIGNLVGIIAWLRNADSTSVETAGVARARSLEEWWDGVSGDMKSFDGTHQKMGSTISLHAIYSTYFSLELG